VGEMAGWLGHKADAKLFAARGQNYHNVIDPQTGFARGRHEDGSWGVPFDPAKQYTYITEGLPFQYTFFVPQDVPGLIETVGGRQAFVKKLVCRRQCRIALPLFCCKLIAAPSSTSQ
jgi:putative alpha-1,2-mannosidase